MTANVFLAAAMERAGLGQAELAERLNLRIEQLTGSPGNLSDRHIRHWLTGKTRWPQRRQRLVLEAEFGASAEELGFIARARITPAPPEDDDVRRRTFTTAAASFTATALAPGAPSGTSRIGMADADRLEANFARLIHADNTAGLSVDLETRALAHAQHALDLMAIGAATERVRKRLYALAAAFTGTALWAAIDRMEPDRAGRHLDRGLRLARLSGDTAMEMRLWGHASVLYVQQRQLPDAVAAAEMSSTTHVCRRDPLFRSLAAARLAAVHAQAGERAAAHRALSRADAAFHRINAMERPAFVDFYDRAEFEGLAGITMLRLARHEEAEDTCTTRSPASAQSSIAIGSTTPRCSPLPNFAKGKRRLHAPLPWPRCRALGTIFPAAPERCSRNSTATSPSRPAAPPLPLIGPPTTREEQLRDRRRQALHGRGPGPDPRDHPRHPRRGPAS
ncbi:hypothetical protein ACFQ60_07595 [Streptomyces zhihengii]